MTQPAPRETEFWKRVFRDLPSAALLLDRERRVLALNAMAEGLLRATEEEARGLRPGDVFHCLNARRDSAGCGFSDCCSECVLRTSIAECLSGTGFYQREVRISSPREGTSDVEERFFLLSGSPVRTDAGPSSLVLLQDVTALHRLRGLIPICAACKKIRREDSAWEALESYISAHSHADFTHGLCPDCLKKYYSKPSRGT